MIILNAFSTGVRRATSEPKMVFVLYLLNFLLAVPLALAFRSVLVTGFGSSLAPAAMMESLDFTVFQDFMNVHSANLQTVFGQILSVFVLSMIVQTFLAGGILTVLQDQAKYSSAAFFKGCGAYFFRFFRIFLLFGVILLLTAVVVGAVVFSIAEGLTESASSEVTELWIRISAFVLFLLPVMLVMMAGDYAKIHMVLYDQRSAFRMCGRGFAFVFRRFFAAFGLGLLMLLIPVLLSAVYLLIDLSAGMTSEAAIALMFVVQQLFMMMRAWTRVFFLAGEMALYRSLQRQPFTEFGMGAAVPGMERA